MDDFLRKMETLEQMFKKQADEINILKSVINDIPGSIYWKDRNGIFLGCNIFSIMKLKDQGINQASIIGKTNHEIFPKEIADQYEKHDLQVINKGIEICIEETATTHNGEILTQLSYKKPLRDQKGNIIGIMGNTVDITHLKKIENELREQKEKAEAANNAKTEFLENMRHDIRTPISAIVGFSDLLRNEKDNNKIQKYTEQLADAGKELLRFLSEVLESINVASGEIPLLKKKFNLKTVLENVIKLHNPIANEKHLNLELSFDECIPKYLMGDPVRIYRIVLELLVNSLKFTKEGYVKISTKLAAKNERDMVIQIEIEDTGPGVPLEKQQELFVRFKRLTASYQGIYKGAGLGLSIVKQFMDDLQGEIHYIDNKNKGAKFVCLIPIKESLLENTLGEDSDVSISSYSHLLEVLEKNVSTIFEEAHINTNQKIHILIVEDHPIAASVAQELLTKSNCSVEIAFNGEIAIKLARENHYDIIFMDIGLPDIDGYEATKQIRLNENASHHRIPIIGLTAHADLEKKKQGLDVGMNVVLTKPLMQETVIEILKNFGSEYLSESKISEDQTVSGININDYKIIDFEVAKKTLNGSSEMVEKILNTFVSRFEEESNHLDQAYSRQDWKTIESIAHKLKGGCEYCGSFRLKEACNQLLYHLEKNNSKVWENLYQQMREEMQNLKWYVECSEVSQEKSI